MFKWMLRGIFAVAVLMTGGLFTAKLYGAVQENLIIRVITFGYTYSAAQTEYRYHLFDLRADLRLDFPISTVRTTSSSIGLGNQQNHILISDSEVLNPDNDRLVRRLTQHTVDIYEVDTEKLHRALTYTQRWSRAIPDSRISLPNMMQIVTSPPTTDERTSRLLLLHMPAMAKLFIYDTADNYRLRHTLSVDMLSTNQFSPYTMSLSPDETQIALSVQGNLMLMNIDGSNRRLFDVDAIDWYPMWSDDSEYILVTGFRFPSVDESLKVLDVNTGQWLPEIARLSGQFPRWMCHGKWLGYSTSGADSSLNRNHMIHMESGRVLHLSNHPALNHFDGELSVYSPDCNHMIISSELETNQNMIPPTTTFTIHISNFDFSNIRLVDESIISSGFWGVGQGRITYQQASTDALATIYEKPLGRSQDSQIMGYVPPNIRYADYISLKHRVAIFRTGGPNPNGNSTTQSTREQIVMVDLSNGQQKTLYETAQSIWSIGSYYDDNQ